MPVSRNDVLADPGFWQKPLDFQEKVLTAVDPAFSALGPEQRIQALTSLNVQRGGATINIDPSVSPEDRAKILASFGPPPPPPTATAIPTATSATAAPAAVPAKAGPRLGLSELPAAIGAGLLNIPGTIAGYIGDTASLLPHVGAPTAVSPYEPRRSRLGNVGVALKQGAEGVANALTFGALSNLLPPPIDEGEAARRRVGELVGGAISGKGAYEGAKMLVRPVLAALGTGAAAGAVPGLSQGDIPAAVEGATTGAGITGVGLGAAKGIGAAAKYPAYRRLVKESKALGGGTGVMQEINKQMVEGRVPETFTESPASVAEAGKTIQNAGLLAAQKVREQSTLLRNEAVALAPKDAVVPNSSVAALRGLVDESAIPSLQSATQKKLGALANDLDKKIAGPQIGFGRRGMVGAPPEVIEQVRAALGLKGGGLTFEELVSLREDLSGIPQPNDAAGRLVKFARKAVDADINAFAKQAPDAVKAYHQWQKFYADEVAQYHAEGAPLRSLTNQKFGRFDTPESEVIPKLTKMAPEEIQNVIQGIRKGPNGINAVDNINAGGMQYLRELATDPITGNFNPKTFVHELGKPAVQRQYRELLGPRFNDAMRFKSELQKIGLDKYDNNPTAVKFSEAFHVFRGGARAATGNPLGAVYDAAVAGMMFITPNLFSRILNNKVGAKLLAAGLLEKPGTPRAKLVTERLAKVADEVGGESAPAGPPPQLPPGYAPPPPLELTSSISRGYQAPPAGYGAPVPALRGVREMPIGQPIAGAGPDRVISGPRGEPRRTALPGAMSDAQDVINIMRQRFAQGGPASADELAALDSYAKATGVPAPLRRLSARLFEAFSERTGPNKTITLPAPPDSALPGMGSRRETPAAPAVSAPPKPVPVPMEQLSPYERQVLNESRSEMGSLVKQLSRVKKTPEPGTRSATAVLTSEVKHGKFAVSPGEMRELKSNLGPGATKWFSVEGARPVEEAMELLSREGVILGEASWDAMIEALLRKKR